MGIFKSKTIALAMLYVFSLPLSGCAQQITLPIMVHHKAIELGLPKAATIQHTFSSNWRYDESQLLGKGIPLIQITFPQTFPVQCGSGPHICHDQYFIRIGVSISKKGYEKCLLPKPLPEGITIKKNPMPYPGSIAYIGGDASMGTDLDMQGMAFRIQHHCYAIELIDMSGGYESYAHSNPRPPKLYHQIINKFVQMN